MTSITKATGDYSISVGYGSSSTGHNGIALGFQSNETDDKSISIGYKADAGRIPGHLWNSPTSDDSSSWSSITYNTPTVGDLSGTPIFVAVSNTGTYSVMTSQDGITWTERNTNGDGKTWKSVTAAVPSIGSLSGNMLFVAVGPPTSNSEGVIVSQDGINWTLKNTVNRAWTSVTHGLLNGITTFVAVCNDGSSVSDNCVMTSQDANTWTIVLNTGFANDWRSVTSGIPSVGDASNNTLFVAVSFDSYVMTSTDSTTWVRVENPATNSIKATSVCVGTPHTGNYANQTLFVAVGHANSNQDDDVIMISNDGYTWTSKSAGSVGNGLNWESVTAGVVNGVTLFAAVSSSGTGNRVMTSYDGENWTVGSNTPDNSWKGIVSGIPSTGTYAGEEIFVAVSSDGTSSRVMTSNMMCKNSIAIGSDAITGGQNSIALGNGASTGQYHNSVAIGQGTTTGADDSIILGNGTQNVGIGTSNPDNILTVSGGAIQLSPFEVGTTNFAIYSFDDKLFLNPRTNTGEYDNINGIAMSSSGALSNSGEITAPSFNATSDFRLKKDISNLSNVLENVCRLQGVEFVRKDDETQRKQLGFIAQDVEEIFPQLVQTEDSKEKYKSVSYANTCALLVEAVKEIRGEMTAENALLKTEIASLKTEIETMKSNK